MASNLNNINIRCYNQDSTLDSINSGTAVLLNDTNQDSFSSTFTEGTTLSLNGNSLGSVGAVPKAIMLVLEPIPTVIESVCVSGCGTDDAVEETWNGYYSFRASDITISGWSPDIEDSYVWSMSGSTGGTGYMWEANVTAADFVTNGFFELLGTPFGKEGSYLGVNYEGGSHLDGDGNPPYPILLGTTATAYRRFGNKIPNTHTGYEEGLLNNYNQAGADVETIKDYNSGYDLISKILLVDTVNAEQGENTTDPVANPTPADNKVLAFIVFRDDADVFSNPIVNNIDIKIDFDGEAQWIGTSPVESGGSGDSTDGFSGGSGNAYMSVVPSNILFDIHGVGNDEIEVEGADVVGILTTDTDTVYSVEETIVDGGFSNQKNSYLISGKLPRSTSARIANVKITAESGYYFSSAPYLDTESSSNIKITTISKEKTNGKITSYVLSLSCKNTKRLTSNIEAGLRYETSKFRTRSQTLLQSVISDIDIGSYIMPSTGDDRIIRIYGTKGATWGLAINESFEDDEIDVDASGSAIVAKDSRGFTRRIINKHEDKSILKYDFRKNILLSSVIDNYGKKISVLKGVIGPSGVSSFRQKFPSSIVKYGW